MIKPHEFKNTFLIGDKPTSVAEQRFKDTYNENVKFLAGDKKTETSEKIRESNRVGLKVENAQQQIQTENVKIPEIVSTQEILDLINDEGSTIKQIQNASLTGNKVVTIADRAGANYMVPLYNDDFAFQSDKKRLTSNVESDISGKINGSILKPDKGDNKKVLFSATSKLAQQMKQEFQNDDWKIVKEEEAYAPKFTRGAKHFLFQLKNENDGRSANIEFKLITDPNDKFMKQIAAEKGISAEEYAQEYTHDDLTATLPFTSNLPMLVESIELIDAKNNLNSIYLADRYDSPSAELIYERADQARQDDYQAKVVLAKELLSVIDSKEPVSKQNRGFNYEAMGMGSSDREIKGYGREINFVPSQDSDFWLKY